MPPILGVGCLLAYAWHRERLFKEAAESKSKPSLTQSAGGVAGGILVVFLVYNMRNSGLDAPVRRSAVQASHKADLERRLDNAEMLLEQSKVATATERYWQDTVAPLYLARYDWPADAQQNALASVRRLLQQTQTTVAKARRRPMSILNWSPWSADICRLKRPF